MRVLSLILRQSVTAACLNLKFHYSDSDLILQIFEHEFDQVAADIEVNLIHIGYTFCVVFLLYLKAEMIDVVCVS